MSAPVVTERDREKVERYLGVFLVHMERTDPNTARATNMRCAAERMLAEERARCVAIAHAKEQRTVQTFEESNDPELRGVLAAVAGAFKDIAAAIERDEP